MISLVRILQSIQQQNESLKSNIKICHNRMTPSSQQTNMFKLQNGLLVDFKMKLKDTIAFHMEILWTVFAYVTKVLI